MPEFTTSQPFFVQTNTEDEHLEVFLFDPGMPIIQRLIENKIQVLQDLLGSPLATFEIGVEGVIGVAAPENIGRAEDVLQTTVAGTTQFQNRLVNQTFSKAGVSLFGIFLLFRRVVPSNNDENEEEVDYIFDALDPEMGMWRASRGHGIAMGGTKSGTMRQNILPLPSTKKPMGPLAPPCPTIQVLVFPPGALPEVRSLRFCVEDMQVLVEISDPKRNRVKSFYTGVHGTTGFGNINAMNSLRWTEEYKDISVNEFIELKRSDEYLTESYEEYIAERRAWANARGPVRPVNRIVPRTGEEIRGLFFVACYRFRSHSLSPPQLDKLLEQFAPELTLEQSTNIMLSLEGGADWLESRPSYHEARQ